MLDDALLHRLAVEPIPGAERAGGNAKYESEHVQLDEEVAKLGSPTAAAVDWPLIARLSTTILMEKSKDFVIACWLARAWFQRDGVPGLAAGSLLLTRLAEHYWDDGFPPLARVRARRAALGGFADGIAPQLETAQAPTDAVLAASAAVMTLHQLLAPRLDNGDTGMGQLTRGLDILAARAAADAPAAAAPVDVAAAPGGLRPVTKPAPVPAGEPAGRAEAVAALRAAAAWFRAQEPHSPVSHLVDRAARWSELPFPELMRDLLANHAGARSELTQVLGLPPEAT